MGNIEGPAELQRCKWEAKEKEMESKITCICQKKIQEYPVHNLGKVDVKIVSVYAFFLCSLFCCLQYLLKS